jgi:hypothetical protein
MLHPDVAADKTEADETRDARSTKLPTAAMLMALNFANMQFTNI